MKGPVVPVSPEQIEAATLIHDGFMPGWAASARFLRAAESMPAMETAAVTRKVAAINEHLHTRCPARKYLVPIIVSNIAMLPEQPASMDDGVALACAIVEQGAEIAGKRYWSFASKFVHWFVTDAAPMYDRWSCLALEHHLGSLSWGATRLLPTVRRRDREAPGSLRPSMHCAGAGPLPVAAGTA